MARVLIAGCGYVGTALALRLAEEGHKVWGLRRHPDPLPSNISLLVADLTAPETLQDLPTGLDFVFFTAAPEVSSDEDYRATYVDGLRHLLEALQRQRQPIRRVFFTSSTTVYAQSDGSWVDEGSPTEPAHFAGIRMLEAERLVLGGLFPATVLRLGGVYGPGRGRLLDRVRQGDAVCPEGPPVYTNRIHRDDCAGALQHLMTLATPENVYVGVDDEPAEECTVLRWLAAQLGVPPPRMGPPSGVDRRRHRGNKRCRNTQLVNSGYRLQYPTYRAGYLSLLSGGER
ncbi:MAG: SDR family oxidoreductase [Candidatus Methylomirabilales bacterium]